MAHAESPDRDQTISAAGGNTPARKRRPSPEPPTTLGQVLRMAYARKGRPITLSSKHQKVVAQNLTLSPESEESLRLLASEDVLFAVPRELLLLSSDPKTNLKLRGALQDVARSALLAHPFLSSPELQNAIRNTNVDLEPGSAVASVMRIEPRDVEDQAVKSLKATAFVRLRLNVAHALALSIAQVRSLDNQSLANMLFHGIWQEAANKVRSDAKRLRLLTDSTQLKGMATSSGVFQRAADQADQRASDLAARAARTSQMLVESQTANIALRERVDEQERRHVDEQAAAQTRLAELSARADDQAVHLRDERETLRTRLLRTLKSDLDLLQSGLDAVNRPVSKPEVLVDAAHRVADSLRQQLRHLEGG